MNRIEPREIKKIRHRLALAARHLYKMGYVKGKVGNFSHRIGNNEMIIKPLGMSFRGFSKENFTRMDYDGNFSGVKPPSGEWHLHAEIYKIEIENKGDNKVDIHRKVIIHTHPPQLKSLFKKTLKNVEKAINNLDEDQSEGLNKEGISIVREFRRYSEDLAIATGKTAEKGNKIIILWSHGLVTIGETIEEAVNFTETACDVLEYF